MHHHEPDGAGVIACILFTTSLLTAKGNIMSHGLVLHNEIDIDQSDLEESVSEIQLTMQNKSISPQETLHCGYMPPYRAAYTFRSVGIIEC